MLRSFAVHTLLFALAGSAAFAQSNSAKPATAVMPNHALALLHLGARRNGLTAPGLKPWHIKVSYRTYKPNGHPRSRGTFEEWWGAPDEYHIDFDRKGYHLQAWVTPHGSFAIGNPDLPMPERLVYHWMVAPIPQHPDLRGAKLRYRVRLIGPNEFPCVQIKSRKSVPGNLPPQYPTYCFGPDRPVLRIANTQVAEIVTVMAAGTLRGQYLPVHLVATLNARRTLSARLEQGQSYSRIDPAFFAPPSDAKSASPPSTAILYLTAQEAATHLIPYSTMRSDSSKIIRASHVYTALTVTIGANGRVENPRVVVPVDPELLNEIYNAVVQWRYRPFLLHGVAVPVRTQIIIDYRVHFPK